MQSNKCIDVLVGVYVVNNKHLSNQSASTRNLLLVCFRRNDKIISNSLQKFTYNTKKNHIFKVNFNFFLNYTLICQFKAYKLLLHIKSCK